MTYKVIPIQTTAQSVPAFLPAPTGDELDVLVHECCHTIETYFTLRKRLSPEFRPRDGVHSTELMQGQQSWASRDHHGVRGLIENGTLRDINELSTAIRKMMTAIDYRIAMRKIEPTWQFDNDALVILGSYFGVEGAPTSREELWAQREERRLADARREAERKVEWKRQQEEYAQSPEGREFAAKMARDEFKRDQLRIVMDALFPLEHLDYANPDNPSAEERAANKHKRLANEEAFDERKFWEPKIRQIFQKTNLAASAVVRVYKNAEQEWCELSELLEDRIEITKDDWIMNTLAQVANESMEGNPAPLTKSCVPPTIDGVERVTAAKYADLVPIVEEYLAKGYALDMRRDFEGLVLTGVPEALRDQWEQHCAMWNELVGEDA
jgi:hypothetical protein